MYRSTFSLSLFIFVFFATSFFLLSCQPDRITGPAPAPIYYINHFVVLDCDSTLRTILDSANTYFSNPNFDPSGYMPLTLTTSNTVLSGASYQWHFEFELGYNSDTHRHFITGIKARNIPAALNGTLSDVHIDQASGVINTVNVNERPVSHTDSAAAYSRQAQGLLYRIARANLAGRRLYGGDATTVQSLIDVGLLPQQDTLYTQWTVSMVGQNPTSQIQAISTSTMPSGAGKVVTFTLATQTFSGYGLLQ